jgi:hypothetical protein
MEPCSQLYSYSNFLLTRDPNPGARTSRPRRPPAPVSCCKGLCSGPNNLPGRCTICALLEDIPEVNGEMVRDRNIDVTRRYEKDLP